MAYYFEPQGRYLSDNGVSSLLGSQVLDWSSQRQQEIGLFPASLVDYTGYYNTYTQYLDSTTWAKYDSEGSFFDANPTPFDSNFSIPLVDEVFVFPVYYGTRTIVGLSDSDIATKTTEAKARVFKETADRLAVFSGAQLAATYLGKGLSDSVVTGYVTTLAGHYTASDSAIRDLAHGLDIDSGWSAIPKDFLSAAAGTIDSDGINDRILNDPYKDSDVTALVGSQLVQAYASWDGSAAGSYTWATGELSSFGVDSVSRISEGSFRVHFTTPFTDSNYAVTTGIGADRYGGAGASPRQLTVVRSEMNQNYVTVHCERTDDAVDEDNEYYSVMIMGTV